MKKFLIVFVSMILIFSFQTIQSQTIKNKNIFGFSFGFIFPLEHGIYFDDPFDFFPKQEWSNPIQIFYERELSHNFRIGTYLGYCKNNFSVQSGPLFSFKRITLGVNWITKYPEKQLHAQLGGFFGYALVAADNWNNLNGLDFGLIAGPAYETLKWGVACHLMAGFAPLYGENYPEGVLLYSPRLVLKGYIKL